MQGSRGKQLRSFCLCSPLRIKMFCRDVLWIGTPFGIAALQAWSPITVLSRFSDLNGCPITSPLLWHFPECCFDPLLFFLYFLLGWAHPLYGFKRLLNNDDSKSRSPVPNFPCTSDSHIQFPPYISTRCSNILSSPGFSSGNSNSTCLKLVWLRPLPPLIFDLSLFLNIWYQLMVPIESSSPENLGAQLILPVASLPTQSALQDCHNRMIMWSMKRHEQGWRVSLMAKNTDTQGDG